MLLFLGLFVSHSLSSSCLSLFYLVIKPTKILWLFNLNLSLFLLLHNSRSLKSVDSVHIVRYDSWSGSRNFGTPFNSKIIRNARCAQTLTYTPLLIVLCHEGVQEESTASLAHPEGGGHQAASWLGLTTPDMIRVKMKGESGRAPGCQLTGSHHAWHDKG